MLITMVMWQPIKGRGKPTGACVRAHPPTPPPPPKNVRSRDGSVRDALPGGGCGEKDARRCFGESRCFVSAQRVMRLKTRLHHRGCACAALRLASITSAPLWSQLTPPPQKKQLLIS